MPGGLLLGLSSQAQRLLRLPVEPVGFLGDASGPSAAGSLRLLRRLVAFRSRLPCFASQTGYIIAQGQAFIPAKFTPNSVLAELRRTELDRGAASPHPDTKLGRATLATSGHRIRSTLS